MQRFIKWWSVITLFIMLFVLIGGALVTKTGSGDGCGTDWPLCNGKIIPDPFTLETVIEWSHRLFSAAAGIFVLVLAVLAWRYYGHIRETKFLCGLSFVFLVIQGLFGAAAVVWGQVPAVLALHFGVSLISFAAVFLLTALIFEIDKKFKAEQLIVPKTIRTHSFLVLAYSYIVVYTGALVRHVNASLSCPNWPLCSDRFLGLPYGFHEWVQMTHRFASGIIWIWIGYILYLVYKKYRHEKALYYGWLSAFILVSLQAIAGAVVVFTNLSLAIALLHALFISLLFGLLCYEVLLATRSNNKERILEQEAAIQANQSLPM